MKRIGEILIEHGWVDPAVVERALQKQREFPRRLCSLLIAGGALESDLAARALGEQHGVPAVLQKHLAYRDRELAALIPAEIARAWFVIPIGRMGNGDLIVCARDPGPEVRAALAGVLAETIVLAVAPASQIEILVAETYGGVEQDFEVDLSTGPIRTLDPDRDPMAGFGNLQLVELDDQGVTRDLTQSGMIQTGPQRRNALPPSSAAIRVPPLPPPSSSAPRAERAAPSAAEPAPRTLEPPPFDPSTIAVGTDRPRRAFVGVAVSLPETLDTLSSARTAEEATTAAMRFAAGRWRAALLLRINDTQAIGRAGHGNQLSEDVIAGLAFPLAVPSLITIAFESGALATEPPTEVSPVQDRLERLLGMPRFPAAIPIVVPDRCAYVLVSGDPITEDTDAATADLDRLARALGAVHARLPPGM